MPAEITITGKMYDIHPYQIAKFQFQKTACSPEFIILRNDMLNNFLDKLHLMTFEYSVEQYSVHIQMGKNLNRNWS